MKRARLPDGTPLWSDEPLGVATVWDEISAYFEAGESVRAGETVFDVGANIGLFSIAALRQSSGGARIWSFEPIPATFAVLAANARLLDSAGEQWLPVRAGLGAKNELALLHFFPRLSVLSGRMRGSKQARRELDELLAGEHIGAPFGFLNRIPRPIRRVLGAVVGVWALRSKPIVAQIWTLSEALEKFDVARLDWLKIDVEGAELDVLRGIEAHHWPRIERVILETESLAAAHDVTALLEANGFAVEVRANAVIQGGNLRLLLARRNPPQEAPSE